MLAGAAGLLWLGVRAFEWINLYRPVRTVDTDPAAAGLEFEEVLFMTEDLVRLHGWWIPHPQARGSVVYCHGNAGNIGGRVGLAADLHALGLNVLLFDYRGYGRSRGFPTERGTYRDACAAYEVVRARHDDADQPPVLIIGASLGGAVAADLATRKPARGLVIEGSFDSATEVGQGMYPALPVRALLPHRYEAATRLARLRMPKLIVHSRDDEVIPYPRGQALFRSAAEPKRFLETCGPHGEAGWQQHTGYAQALRAFVDQLFPPQ